VIGVEDMSKKLFYIIFFLYLLSFPVKVLAQLADTPWPKFHHDLRNTGKTSNFGTQVGKLKWKFVTGGAVTSSPAIDNNGMIYIGSSDNNFYAINAETGALEWKYTTGGAINHSSPVIDINGVVYIGSYDGNLYAFDTTTIDPLDPEIKWKYKTGGAIASSPTIDDDGTIMFASADGSFYALNPNGTLKWKKPIGSSWGSPAIDTSNSQVYIGSWDPQSSDVTFAEVEVDNETSQIAALVNFFAMDTSDGDCIWDFPHFCTPGGIVSSPAIGSDLSVIVSFDMHWSQVCDDDESKFNVWRLPYNYNPYT